VHLLRRRLGLVLTDKFFADRAAGERRIMRVDVDTTDAFEEAVHALREIVDHRRVVSNTLGVRQLRTINNTFSNKFLTRYSYALKRL